MTIEQYEIKKEQLLKKSMNRPLVENVVEAVFNMLDREGIAMDLEQKAALVSHLSLLVSRAQYGGAVPSVNPKIFNELSELSLELAGRVIAHFPTLAEVEKYLLAIHFSLLRLK